MAHFTFLLIREGGCRKERGEREGRQGGEGGEGRVREGRKGGEGTPCVYLNFP